VSAGFTREPLSPVWSPLPVSFRATSASADLFFFGDLAVTGQQFGCVHTQRFAANLRQQGLAALLKPRARAQVHGGRWCGLPTCPYPTEPDFGTPHDQSVIESNGTGAVPRHLLRKRGADVFVSHFYFSCKPSRLASAAMCRPSSHLSATRAAKRSGPEPPGPQAGRPAKQISRPRRSHLQKIAPIEVRSFLDLEVPFVAPCP